jgi:hypothetical protein
MWFVDVVEDEEWRLATISMWKYMSTVVSLIYNLSIYTESCIDVNIAISGLPQLDDITLDSLSSVSHSLVQGWIKKCDSTHTLCDLQKSSVCPKRLLYILPIDDNIVQLVSGARDEPYIALSHC